MLEILNLYKKIHGREVIKDFSLKVEKKQILALIGPSGCGKTTLLRLIAGLETPDSGTVIIDGCSASSSKKVLAPHKRKIGMIFQDLALWPHMTVQAHLEYVVKGKGTLDEISRQKIQKLLRSMQLEKLGRSYPHQLSGGEQQRLAIGRALIQEPQYLLMDEPFSNLDPLVKAEMEMVVAHFQKESSLGILYVTHNLRDLERITDEIAVMGNGELLQYGQKNSVVENPANQFVKKMVGFE